MSDTYRAPYRAPDELLTSGLSDFLVRVWLAIRAVQGGKPGTDVAPTRFSLSYIGERCGKSANAVSKAYPKLAALGWIEVVGFDGKTPLMRCHIPGDGGDDSDDADDAPDIMPEKHDVMPEKHDDDAYQASHDASQERSSQASCLTSTMILPVEHDDPASQASSHYRESSCLDPSVDPVSNTTLVIEGGAPGPNGDEDGNQAGPESQTEPTATLDTVGVPLAVSLDLPGFQSARGPSTPPPPRAGVAVGKMPEAVDARRRQADLEAAIRAGELVQSPDAPARSGALAAIEAAGAKRRAEDAAAAERRRQTRLSRSAAHAPDAPVSTEAA